MVRRRDAVVFSEKEFYLDEFRGRTLLFAVHHDGAAERLRELGAVARDLLLNDTRVLMLLAGVAGHGRAALRALERVLTTLAPETQPTLPLPQLRLVAGNDAAPVLTLAPDELGGPVIADDLLVRMWRILRTSLLLVGLCGASSPARLAGFAQRLGARLRVHKLVIVDAEGGVRHAGASRPLSFMDEAMTEQLLHAGEAEWAGLGARRPLLEAIRQGLLAGISSINLCRLDSLARELFTYEGSGTLFTREDYCRVERLGLDDFHEVEKLLERGQSEGYLKDRSGDEIARILIAGYGATIGEHHLAGVCALQTEPYAASRAGEIVGLYTITRFKGEGVGVKLVSRVKAEAAARGLTYLFACTTQERAAHFFERQGFRRVGHDEVPPEKWVSYDVARRRAVMVYRVDLEVGRC